MAPNPKNRSTHEPMSLNEFYDDLKVLTPIAQLRERMLVYDFKTDDVFFIEKIHRIKGRVDVSTSIRIGLVEDPTSPTMSISTTAIAFTTFTAHTVSRMLPVGYIDDHHRLVYTDFNFKEAIFDAKTT